MGTINRLSKRQFVAVSVMLSPAQVLARIFIAWLTLMGLVAAANESPAEIKERLQAVQERIRATRAKFAEEQGEAGELEAALARLEAEIGNVAKRLRDTAEQLDTERTQLEVLDRRKQEKVKELVSQRAALALQLRAAYVMGRQEKLKLLLNQQEPQAVGRMLVYYDYINRVRGRRIDAAGRSLIALREVENKVRAQTHQLAQVAGELRAQQVDLVDARAQRARVLAALTREMGATGRSLDVLIRDEEQLENLLERIRTALADIPPLATGDTAFGRLQGKLPWPSPGPIVTQFGNYQTDTADMVSQGVVIGADMGAEVRAVSGGRIVFAEWMRGFGLLMIIDHGDGYMSLYGHNQSLYKSVGAWVEAGELIARVGDSGGLATSGLYFEIRHQGKPLDPAAWCSATAEVAGVDS
jgi:septal ring factor EnvC (AmiA/AmiB activator)